MLSCRSAKSDLPVVIESLELTNFRNFESRKLFFHNRNVFFLGKNGAGKSNLLESIGFASLLRSFRGASPREMIRIGSREFQLKTILRTRAGCETLNVIEHISGKRELFIQNAPVQKSSDFIHEFHTVVFAPEDRMIVSGSSGFRRRYFDILISGVEPEYLLRLSRYQRALIQRNRALKSSPHLAGAFEEELALQAPFIAETRRRYAGAVAEACTVLLAGKADFAIQYRGDSGGDPAEHRKILALKHESELRRQCTLCGPQLDEFEMFFNGKLLRTYGSTGQIRLISLLLKLAQFRLLRTSSAAPVAVLADDVTGELDANNLQLFLDTISGAQQCFFTFAEPPRFVLPDSVTLNVAENG